MRGVRSLRVDQIHLTVSFLGNVGSIAENTLREKLAALRFATFFIPVARVGTFPQRGSRTLFGRALAPGIRSCFTFTNAFGKPRSLPGEPDLRAFHPHITLARCKDVSAESVRPFLKQNADFDAGLVRVESFALYSSQPGPLGSAYTRELQVKAQR